MGSNAKVYDEHWWFFFNPQNKKLCSTITGYPYDMPQPQYKFI